MKKLKTMEQVRQLTRPEEYLELYKLDSIMLYWKYLLDREIELGRDATTQDELDARVSRINDMQEKMSKAILGQQRILQDQKMSAASARLLFYTLSEILMKYVPVEQKLAAYEEWRALATNYFGLPAPSIEVGRQLVEGDIIDMEDNDE